MADRIHPTAIIDKGASIADDVTIGCYSFIGADVTLNEGCVLHSHVVIDGRTTLGKNNEVYPFAVLGKAPQHIKYEGEPSMLEIGDNNVIRESVTIHRGTAVGTMKTVIGDNNNFFAGVHIAHDCIIANNTIFVNDSMAGGHAEVDDFAYISSNSGIRQFVRIGKYAMVAPTAAITSDVIPFGFAFGVKSALSGLNLIGLRRAVVSLKSRLTHCGVRIACFLPPKAYSRIALKRLRRCMARMRMSPLYWLLSRQGVTSHYATPIGMVE